MKQSPEQGTGQPAPSRTKPRELARVGSHRISLSDETVDRDSFDEIPAIREDKLLEDKKVMGGVALEDTFGGGEPVEGKRKSKFRLPFK